MSTPAPESTKRIRGPDHKSHKELAILLQAIACCEHQVEASRLALNVLPFYTPTLAYQLLTELCPGGLLSHSDFQVFLDEWKVEYTPITLKGLLMDFSPIRNILDYQEYLLMTNPASTIDKREIDLNPEMVSEELRFKIESSLVLFILKELKYQDEVEKRRLKLFSSQRHDMYELFCMIDYDAKGYLNYEDTKRFMKSCSLEFEYFHWEALVFRAKKCRFLNPKQEIVTFMEFHDLVFPVTFFMIQVQKDISNWLNYLDGIEREADPATPDESTIIGASNFAKGMNDQTTTPNKRIQSNIPTETKQSKAEYHSSIPSHIIDGHKTEKKSRNAKSKLDLSFFDSLYRVTEDESFSGKLAKAHNLSTANKDIRNKLPGPPPPSWRMVSGLNTQRGLKSARAAFDESFFEAGMDEPWLPFNKEYEGFYKGRGVLSKFTRYMMSFLEAANIMYG